MSRGAGAFLCAGLAALALARHGPPPLDGQPSPPLAGAARQAVTLKRPVLPLAFEVNQGQAPPEAKFVVHVGGAVVLVSSRGLVTHLPGEAGARGPHRLELVGAADVEGEALGPLPGKVNYLIGDDPMGWRTGLATWSKLRFRSVWPGVDLELHGERGELEFDFVVHPGASVEQVRFAASEARLLPGGNGDLALGPAVIARRPVTFQPRPWGRQSVESGFLVAGNLVAFRVAPFDPGATLVIDPVLSFSTFLGGGLDDRADAVAYHGSGALFVAGSTASTNFPLSTTPLQATNGGGSADAFVTKLAADGTAIVFSTYLGGAGGDGADSISVDLSGNAVVSGRTYSTDFPLANAVQATRSGADDAFVARLGSTGSALIFSTYLGGAGSESGAGVAMDPSGFVYVTGFTTSVDFPTVGPFQAGFGGGVFDAYVTRLSGSGARLYSTFLGGTGDDYGNAIAVDAAGNAFITGHTTSNGFPTTSGAWDTNRAGAADAFVTKLGTDGLSLVWSTFLGGNQAEYGNAIAIDAAGSAYVAGSTESAGFPTLNPAQAVYGGGLQDAFVTRLTPSGNALVYSTFLGGSLGDRALGIAVDGAGRAAVTGFTGSTDFPLVSPLQASYVGGTSDAFVAVLPSAGGPVSWSTVLGSSAEDYGNGIAVDEEGNLFVAGSTSSAWFPTEGAIQPNYGGGTRDGVLVKLCCTLDGGTNDAGAPDGGAADAGAPDAGPPDAGGPDAGIPDAGTTDAGIPDAGIPDAGAPDAGTTDAGTTDAGTTDAGTTDAGTTDAGATDAGILDAGATDAGSPDAGPSLDSGAAADGGPAGPRIASAPDQTGRCGVQWSYAPVAEPSGGWLWTAPELPTGMSLDASTGRLEWTPAPAQRGSRPVTLRATSSAGSVEQRFSVEVECGSQATLDTKCSCGAAPASFAAGAWLLLLGLSRARDASRRRRR